MTHFYKKHGPWLILLGFLYLSYLLIRPYLITLLTAALIAYIFYPIYKYFSRKTKMPGLSAFLMCLLVYLIVVLPFFALVRILIDEIPAAYAWISDVLIYIRPGGFGLFEAIKADIGVNIDMNSVIQSASTSLLRFAQGIITGFPAKIFNIIVGGFFLYFFFRDGDTIFKSLMTYLPFDKSTRKSILKEFKLMVDAVVYGQLITATIQAVLATIAYSLIGIKSAMLWGVITLGFAIIPVLGPAIIYVFLSLSVIIISMTANDNVGIIKGILLLLFGFGVISSVDNVVKPLIISGKIKMHPALIVLGVFGGINLFGMLGVLLGPLVLVVLLSLLRAYDIREAKSS